MPIPVSCQCGRSYNVKDEQAGKRVKCPGCATVLTIPTAAADDDVIEIPMSAVQEEPPARPGKRPAKEDVVEVVAADYEVVEDESAGYTVEKEKLKPKKPKHRPPPIEYDRIEMDRGRRKRQGGGGGISISPGVIGGLVAMVGAVVWFVVGLWAGWIFFYPPILFILGLITFFKGLLGHEED